jgi:nucleotide-binding universal stress UspA family protein
MATDSSLTILTVIKDPMQRAKAQAIVDQAAVQVNELAGLPGAAGAGIATKTKVRLGHPAEEIVGEAGECGYNFIVVGTWPKRHLLDSLLAPTTERIIMQAPCPVLVAKGRVRPFDHILLCVSGANSPSPSACTLAELAKHFTRPLAITVLHVMSQISVGPDKDDDWQLVASAEELMRGRAPEGQLLRREIEILKRTPAKVRAAVRHGLVVDEVLMEALEGDSDLIVVGAHRHAGWQRYLLDDLTHQILVRADRPVLVV